MDSLLDAKDIGAIRAKLSTNHAFLIVRVITLLVGCECVMA